MGKFSYTKFELEMIVAIQLSNLDAMNERVRLLEQQNELLVKMNHKLAQQLSEEKKTVRPYPKKRNKKESS